MAASLSGVYNLQNFTDLGVLAAGYRLYTYAAGTTTQKTAYTDPAGAVPHTYTNDGLGGQYIALNARGELPAPLFLTSGDYDIALKTAAGVTVWTRRAIGSNDASLSVLTDLANATDTAKGDALIGVKRTETGGVATTQHAINQERPWYPVPDSGAAANDTSDDTALLQSALNASLYVDLGDARRKYKISGALTLRTGHIIRANGAEIRQVTNNTEIFNAEGKSDITIMGVIGRGVGTDYLDSDSSRSVFLYCGTTGSRIHVHFCKLYGFSYTTVRGRSNSHLHFTHNYVEGPGSPTLTAVTSSRCYGFLADSGCSYVVCEQNEITKVAQGVRIEQVTSFSVSDNDIHDLTGQHGIYLGTGLNDGTVQFNRIRTVSLIGIKLQAQNTTSDNRRISISDNTITGCGDQGILTCNGAGSTSQTQKNRGVTIKGNTIRTTTGTGINVQNTIGAVVIGNTVDGAAFSGISLSASSRVTVAENIVENCGQSGIRDEVASTQILVLRNQVRDCATANAVGDRFGIYVQDMTEWTISGNVISDSAARMQYGIYCAGGDQTTVVIQDNQVLNSTDYGLRMKNATDAARIYRGNLWTGTLGPVFNEPALPTVASAATVTLPQGYETVFISGITGITSINAGGHAGRTVRLVFLAALTVTDGLNLKMAGNFTTTADDTLTLVCDGTNWVEVARSVN